MLFDSHAHYDDEKFDNDRDELLASLTERGVSYVINAGSSIKTSEMSIELAEKYGYIYAAVGVHPQDAESFSDKDVCSLREMCSHKKVVAIGEIGLDYYYPTPGREVQKKAFIKQLALAKELKKPVVIHDREAHGDCIDILKESGIDTFGGVMHCFSGSVEMAKIILDMGMYISLGGPVTYKNARHSVEVASCVPADRLLIETDCPYLTPVPHRGERNDSSFMHFTAQRIAEIRGIDKEELAKITLENAKTLFKI